METKVITISNAGNCTAYELRQELVRRKAFDLDENKVNFKALLQRLMVELVADEAKKDEVKVTVALNEANEARDAAKLERERRKAEALERSRQRQANPDYFIGRTDANAQLAVKKAEIKSLPIEVVEEEEIETITAIVDDPFRSYVSKSKNKIFVK